MRRSCSGFAYAWMKLTPTFVIPCRTNHRATSTATASSNGRTTPPATSSRSGTSRT